MVKPYTLYENHAYDQFYTQMVDGKSVMDHLREMYCQKTSIETFTRRGFAFVEKHIDVLLKWMYIIYAKKELAQFLFVPAFSLSIATQLLTLYRECIG